MPELITICLMPEQEEQLKQIRDTHKDAYMRERAAAIIKVAQGMSPRQVALNGLLKTRKPDTVYDWIERFQSEGIVGLSVDYQSNQDEDENQPTRQSARAKKKPKMKYSMFSFVLTGLSFACI
jgi:hypothetical protein